MSAIRCPHCDAAGKVCAHQQQSPLTRKEWHRCENLECGHTFVSTTEVHYTVTPSATPRPGVILPLSSHTHVKASPTIWPNGEPRSRALPRVLDLAVVSDRTGMTKRDILAAIRAGTFPAATGMKAQELTWNESVIEAWIAARLAARSAANGATT